MMEKLRLSTLPDASLSSLISTMHPLATCGKQGDYFLAIF
jgi:hypothetical protein